jgi:xylan 1,4-beta-xylosidase
MEHVRLLGILSDAMGTLIGESDELLYSFFNADQIFDFLILIGKKPFVELSFMPSILSSGDKTVFHYRANVTPRRDPVQWSVLIHKLVAHWVDRYGINEVRQWVFEVWNEPNLTGFGSGKQSEYFELYRHTAEAIKSVDHGLKVGGPATAEKVWVKDFIAFCMDSGLPADFVSTNHYPTDALGKPSDDTETQLSKSTRSILREQARAVRKQTGAVPVYYTEWCASSNPRDAMHDDPYAAAFIVKTILEARGLVDGYSYGTFSDIFEEDYFPSIPSQGGFGLLNIHGIAKPAYRAFRLLHGLGAELLELEGAHETVDAWLVRGERSATIMLTNFALPLHRIATESVNGNLKEVASITGASIQRIDLEHANAKRRWEQMGKHEYLSVQRVADLESVSELRKDAQVFRSEHSARSFDVTMPPQSAASIELQY